MQTVTNRLVPAEPSIAIPMTPDEALDTPWLEQALIAVSHGRKIRSVEVVEFIRTNVTKIRAAVTFEGEAKPLAICIKGMLDRDRAGSQGDQASVMEGDFYTRIAPRLGLRTPEAIAVITDRACLNSVLISRDLIAAGARFNSVLEPFTADQMAASLEQFALLHAGSFFLDEMHWVTSRTRMLAWSDYVTPAELQRQLNDPRGANLSPSVRSAEQLNAGMRALAERDATRQHFLIHGDAHAGNSYQTSDGFGLIDWQMIQRAGWALDVAYHICSALPVDIAESEERRLLGHYLSLARSLGLAMPDDQTAWSEYREACVYGYFMWGITRTVASDIIVQCTNRLGRAVMRHDSFALLGIP